MAREDKMVRDIRGRLKEMKAEGGKYFKGTAKLFLASTEDIMASNMPTFGGMIDMNRDLFTDAVRFMRNPADMTDRAISRAMGSDDVKSIKRLGKNMLDDLKTGNLYDPDRDRTAFGERTRELLNNFGGVDMTGFQSDGSYVEPANSADRKFQKGMLDYQEQSADRRLKAQLDATNYSTKAQIANSNAQHQQNIRLSIKQHSQMMSSMSNMVTQQAATLNAVNTLAASLLDISRESHRQVMDELNRTNTLLEQIVENTTSPQAKAKPVKDDLDFMSPNGAIDIKKYLRTVGRNVNTKYNLSGTMNMMTGGMGARSMIDMLQNNPWMAVTTVMLDRAIPEYLKATMETTQQYLENFVPTMLTKLADRGRRFDSASPENKKLGDFIAGLFGVTPKAGKPGVDNVLRDPNAQAVLTNRTVHAIEQVIPMWLSRIYSGITGEDLGMYNYRTGRMEKAKYAVAREAHNANDYVSRMGTSAYGIRERARSVKFQDPEMDEAFQDYVYRYLNESAAKGNQFINPYASRDRLLKDLPQGEDVYKDALIAVLRSMPRKDLMRLSGEMQRARQSRNMSSNAAYTDLQESGMAVLFSGVLGEKETKALTNASKKKQYGLDNYEVDKTMDKAHAHALRTGISVKSTNIAVNDILETLNRGIITYTYLLGDAKSFKGEIPGYRDVLDAQKASGARAASIAHHRATVEKNLAEYKAEQRKERDALAAMGGTGRNKVVTPYGPNRTTFEELLEQQRDVNVNMSGYYTLDNPETQKYLEKQRAKANKDFIYNTLGIKQSKGVDVGPFRLANQALQTVDAAMFKFMFGEDVPEGYGDNENQVTSFMHTLELRLRGEWEMAKNWFSENIGVPLKNFFLGENSIIGRTINRVKERAGEAASNVGKRIGTAFNNRFGDQMDALKAKGQDAGSAAANAMMDAFEKFLYGDDKEHRGKRVDEDGNVTYGGFIGKMKRAGDRFSQFMFGPDANGDDHGSRQKFEFLKKELNIAAPDMIIGGGIGLLGSLFLPGGPILGAVLGMGTGLIKGSETFQKYLFGEEFDREVTVIGSDGNPIMVRDPKTHKLVPKTKTIKSRKGGLISGPIYDGIKQYLPKVGGGAAAGWILGAGLLPGLTGHLVGGFAGSMVGLIASSDRLKRMLFGDEEDETGESGLFSKNLREKVLKAIKEHGGGMVLGRIAGGILGKGAGALAIGAAKMGLIPGVVGALVGPTIASIGSVVGFFAGPKLINMIFGEEQEVEVTDPKTGKKVRRKERMGGMFGKIYDATRDELVRPFAEKMNAVGMKMSDWFQESIIGPLARAMDPAKKAMHDAGEAISRSMANIGDKISASITNAIGMPLNEFMKEKVIDPLERITSKIFGAIGKALGTIISAPFKVMEYIFTGRIEKPSERDRKRRHRAMDRENKQQLRNAGKAKVAEIYGESAANAVEKTAEENPEPESTQKTPDPEKKSAKARNRKVKTDNDRTRESKKKTKPLKKAEEKAVQSDVREQVADANKSRREKRGKKQETGGTVAGKATGVGAKVNNGRIVNRIYDTLLDIRKDIAHIRGKIDSGISMNGKSDRGGGRRRPSVLGSILGLPFRVAGAAARGVGTVASGVLNAGGKVIKGGVDLVGGILGAGVKVISTAGNILISAVSGVAQALGGIVNGMVHLATGAVGLIGNIFGGMLNMAASLGIGLAKGVWNVATVVPRAAIGIIGAGAKAAGAVIGGGLKLAGGIIKAPFKLISGIFGGGHKKRLAKARAQKRAAARPNAAARPSGRTILGMGNGPDGPMPVDLSQFKVSTTQGDAIRVWMVGESESPAERIGQSKDEKARRKEHKDEMKLQKQQLKVMDKMNKRQHRQAIFGLLGQFLASPIQGYFRDMFGNTIENFMEGLNPGYHERREKERLAARVIAYGMPSAPVPIIPVNTSVGSAIPVFIAGDYHQQQANGEQNRPDEGSTASTETGGEQTPNGEEPVSRAYQAGAAIRGKVVGATNKIKGVGDKARDSIDDAAINVGSHVAGAGTVYGERLKKRVTGIFHRAEPGPAVVGENGPEIVGMTGGETVTPTSKLGAFKSALSKKLGIPGYAAGTGGSVNDQLKANLELMEEAHRRIADRDGFDRTFNANTMIADSRRVTAGPLTLGTDKVTSAAPKIETRLVPAPNAANNAGRFGLYKKAYRRINDLIARSKKPKDALDRAVASAQSEEEVQAIRDVQQMDSGAPLMLANQGEKKKGLLETILDAFNGAGGGLKGLAALGAAVFSPFLGPISAIIKAGGTILGNIGSVALGTAGIGTTALIGGAGTAKAMVEGKTGRATGYGARTAAGIGLGIARLGSSAGLVNGLTNIATGISKVSPRLGDAALNAADSVTTHMQGGGVIGKLVSFFQKAVVKLLNSGTVVNMLERVGAKAPNLANKLTTAFANASTRLSAASATSLLAKANIAVMVGMAVYDVTTGAMNANEHFNISQSDVTDGMRLASGLAKGVSGLAFGLLPVDWLAQFLWKIFAKTEDKEKLKEQQSNYEQRVAQYNKEHGTDYSVEQFQKNVKETKGGKFAEKKHPVRNLFQKIGSAVGEGFSGLWGEVKVLGSLAMKALTGHPMELLNYKTQTHIANDNWTSILMKMINVPVKLALFPISVVTMVGREIGKTVGDIFGGIGSAVKGIIDYGKFILSGDVQGLMDYDPAERINDNNRLKPILKVMSVGVKMASLIPTGISWAAHGIFDTISNMVKPLLGDSSAFETDRNNMQAYVDAGDPSGLAGYQLNDTGGVLGMFNKLSKVLYMIPAAFNWAQDSVLSKIPIIGDFFDRDDKKKGVNADGTLKAGYIKDEKTGNVRKMTSAEKKADKENQNALKKKEKARKNYEIQQKGGVAGWWNRMWNGRVDNPDVDEEMGTGRGPVKAYNQKDHRWGNMAEDGCGPTAAATIASAYGRGRGPANPAEANAMSKQLGMRASDGGTDPQFFKEYATRHGFRMQTGPVSGNTMAAAAEGGRPVAVMGKGGPYGPGEHYMVLEGAYGRGKTAVLMDPNGGGRKTVPMNSLVNNTDTAIYSSPGTGRGWGRGDEDETGVTTSQTRLNNTAKAQQALVDKMTWLSNNKIKYSQGATQDPDKGVASCASTVGWAYRKVFGDEAKNMSASTQVQSSDNRFEDIYRFSKPNQGPPGKTFDLSKLQPGDIVYMSSKPGNGHTEMYVGNGMDLSHGGGNWPGGIPEDGPNAVKLNEARQKKVFAVRRYRPFMNGTTPAVSDTTSTGTSNTTGTTEDTEDEGGDFLSKLSGLLSKFTTRMFGGTDTSDPETSSTGDDSGTSAKATGVTLSGSDDKEKIWKFLRKNLGLTAVAAAGVMGNFEQESGNNAHRMEADYTSSFKKIGFDKMASDPEARDKWVKEWLWPKGYKNASWLNRDAYYGADGHTYPGFGLAQWTGTRGYNLFKFAKDNNLNWADLATQLDYFANGANEFKARGLVDKMNADKTTDASAFTFAKYYEGNTTLAQKERKDSARQYYDMYKDLDISDDANENKLSVTVDGMKVSDWATAHRKEYESYEDAVNAFWQLANLQSERGMKGNGKALTGRGWGRGPQVDLVHNAREVTNQIASLNSAMRTQREEQQSATNVETMAKAITDAVQTGTAGGNSEALLQTIATTLGSMLELMSKMADKMDRPTGQGTGGKQEKASDINKAYGRQPTRPSTYPNGATDADDIGADIIRRLTSTH